MNAILTLAILAQTATASILDHAKAEATTAIAAIASAIVLGIVGLIGVLFTRARSKIALAEERDKTTLEREKAGLERARAETAEAQAKARKAEAEAAQAEADRSRRLTATVIRGVEAATKARCVDCDGAPQACADCAARAKATKAAITGEAKDVGLLGALRATVKAVTEPERKAAPAAGQEGTGAADVPDST